MDDRDSGGGSFRPSNSLARTPPSTHGTPVLRRQDSNIGIDNHATLPLEGTILRGTSPGAVMECDILQIHTSRTGKRKVVSPSSSSNSPAPKRLNEDSKKADIELSIAEMEEDAHSVDEKMNLIDSFINRIASKKSLTLEDKANLKSRKDDLKEAIDKMMRRFSSHISRMEGLVEGSFKTTKMVSGEIMQVIAKEVRGAECRLEQNLTKEIKKIQIQTPKASSTQVRFPTASASAPISYADRVKLPTKMAVQTAIRPQVEKIIIYPKVLVGTEKDASQKVKEIVKEAFKDQRSSLKIKGIRDIRKGGIVIEAAEKGTCKAIAGGLQSHPDLVVRNSGSRLPRLFLYDVPRAMADEEVMECIRGQNLEGVSSESFNKEFKLLFKTGAKEGSNPSCHWVVEVSPTLRKKLIDRPRLYVDWTSCRIRDYASVTRCWKCHGFGHPEKYCRQATPTCGHCASSGHDTKSCTLLAEAPKCINCKKFGKPHGHSAKDTNCPAYLRALESELGRTDFGV